MPTAVVWSRNLIEVVLRALLSINHLYNANCGTKHKLYRGICEYQYLMFDPNPDPKRLVTGKQNTRLNYDNTLTCRMSRLVCSRIGSMAFGPGHRFQCIEVAVLQFGRRVLILIPCSSKSVSGLFNSLGEYMSAVVLSTNFNGLYHLGCTRCNRKSSDPIWLQCSHCKCASRKIHPTKAMNPHCMPRNSSWSHAPTPRGQERPSGGTSSRRPPGNKGTCTDSCHPCQC